MTKKGPLSKAEKFYIEQHPELTIKDLCRDLDRAQTTVSKFQKTIKPIDDSKPKSRKGTISDQFARNERGGAVVMTPNASEAADGKRSQYKGSKRSSRCTTRIKD